MRAMVTSLNLLLFLACHSVLAEEQFRLGPIYTDQLYTDQPGELSVVVELPLGVTPEAADFRLMFDNGESVAADYIEPFEKSERGLAIVLCVDTSKSMKGAPFNDTKDALLGFLAKIRPDKDYVAIVAFGDEPSDESVFSDDLPYLSGVIRDLKATGGKTKLYQAIYHSLDKLAKLTDTYPKRRRVLVISDGKDEGSIETQKSVEDLFERVRIPVDAVRRGKIEPQYRESLSNLSNRTGGYYVHARPDTLSLYDATERIYRDLMVTRTLVVYFKYAPDSEKTTQKAVIEWKPPGDIPSVRQNLPENIPLPAEEPGPPGVGRDRRVLLLGITISLALVLSLTVFLLRKKRPKDEKPLPEDKGEVVVTPPPVEIPIKPEPPAQRRYTVVGGYSPEEQTQGDTDFPAPRPESPAAKLIGINGPLQGQEFSVEKEIFRIGANPENDLVITEDEYVSRNHAHLRYDNGSLFLSDQHSRNGTFVNEQRLSDAPVGLSRGDLIQIGNSTLKVVEAPTDTGAGDQKPSQVR